MSCQHGFNSLSALNSDDSKRRMVLHFRSIISRFGGIQAEHSERRTKKRRNRNMTFVLSFDWDLRFMFFCSRFPYDSSRDTGGGSFLVLRYQGHVIESFIITVFLNFVYLRPSAMIESFSPSVFSLSPLTSIFALSPPMCFDKFDWTRSCLNNWFHRLKFDGY